MAKRVQVTRRIVVGAPVDQAFMFFTPAGEELWVDGWQPRYVYPGDGRTEAGMVFTTGEGDDLDAGGLVPRRSGHVLDDERPRQHRAVQAGRHVIALELEADPLAPGR